VYEQSENDGPGVVKSIVGVRVSVSYELLSVSLEKEFRLNLETGDRVLPFAHSCSAEHKGPEMTIPGRGCRLAASVPYAPVRGCYDELSPLRSKKMLTALV